jgi:hypothetical protein
MTTAAMATYAYDQIDQARTELKRRLIDRPHMTPEARRLTRPISQVEGSQCSVSGIPLDTGDLVTLTLALASSKPSES